MGGGGRDGGVRWWGVGRTQLARMSKHISALPHQAPPAHHRHLQILSYHIITGAAVTAAQLTDGQTLTTLDNGQTIAVSELVNS